MLYIIYAVFLAMVGVSLRRPIGALVEGRRQQANLRRELRALTAEVNVAVERPLHLSRPLACLVEETRALRVALDEPIQAARAWLASDRSPWLARLDVGDGSDLDRLGEVDVSLVNARRAVWDWIASVEALPEADRAMLVRLGLSTGTLRGVLAERGAFRRTSAGPRSESARIERMLVPVRAALDRFEEGLVRATRTEFYR